jgi:DNA-binding transcriptional ArsR family regulator
MNSNVIVEKHCRLLAAMGNANRLHILRLIADQELTVGELAATVGLTQSALSQHLAKLRASGLVTTRREHQSIYYSTDHPGVRRILQVLDQIFCELYSKRELEAPSPLAA